MSRFILQNTAQTLKLVFVYINILINIKNYAKILNRRWLHGKYRTKEKTNRKKEMPALDYINGLNKEKTLHSIAE